MHYWLHNRGPDSRALFGKPTGPTDYDHCACEDGGGSALKRQLIGQFQALNGVFGWNYLRCGLALSVVCIVQYRPWPGHDPGPWDPRLVRRGN